MNFLFNLEKKIRGLPANMKPHSMLVTYAIPRGPGRCRILALFPRNFFAINKPRWLDHMERNDVLDGDLVFLHGQVKDEEERHAPPLFPFLSPDHHPHHRREKCVNQNISIQKILIG